MQSVFKRSEDNVLKFYTVYVRMCSMRKRFPICGTSKLVFAKVQIIFSKKYDILIEFNHLVPSQFVIIDCNREDTENFDFLKHKYELL